MQIYNGDCAELLEFILILLFDMNSSRPHFFRPLAAASSNPSSGERQHEKESPSNQHGTYIRGAQHVTSYEGTFQSSSF